MLHTDMGSEFVKFCGEFDKTAKAARDVSLLRRQVKWQRVSNG
jgi:hypothetical protein